MAASRAYVAHVDELVRALQHTVGEIAAEWRGESYQALVVRFDEIIQRLEHSRNLAQTGHGQLVAGYERAQAEERRLQAEG